ncbi:Metallo-dependent hydrolase [Patellaria atrata CBS 101060]|uniref:adenosine deaminase n=1 Tax=Patellaria atrata CBS 101060 TaxID=1346257 RepID=A0A9P4VQ29_9PEZI|nr:Metallo-dependent hydrolase [Patellaria atrata CBS 101060]
MEQSQSEEDTQWEEELGVPSFKDEFIQKYFAGRDALIHEEDKQRSDRIFRENLSPIAEEACAIVDQIRFEEQQTLWTREFEDSLQEAEGDVYPGMMFSLAKERMEKSKLWKIIRRMPKGALLHCHLPAMVDLDWLFEEAFNTKGIHIKASGPLATAGDRDKVRFEFKYTGKPTPQDAANVWSESYQPDTLIPITTAANNFPDGGKEGFMKWVKDRCTITPDESVKHHYGLNDVWKKFTSTFLILGSLTHYEPIFRKFLRQMFKSLLDDGIRWVDLRSAFVEPYRKLGAEEDEEGYFEFFRVFEEELENFKASEEGKGFWGARFIWTTLRFLDKKSVIDHIHLLLDLKEQYPHLIAGYDLVGQEDTGHPLSTHLPSLLYLKKLSAETSLNIPFFFHAGETLGTGTPTDHNLFDAILLGTRRIGHGFSLHKHPLLITMVKEKRILIESCPISNEVLRLTASILSHPLPALLAAGVPCALSNDDPAILGHGTSGSSHDFWQALQGWESLGLAGLGSLAENSVRWAAFEDQGNAEWVRDVKMGAVGKGVRARRMREWAVEWEEFCLWVVRTYGADEDFEGEGDEAGEG